MEINVAEHLSAELVFCSERRIKNRNGKNKVLTFVKFKATVEPVKPFYQTTAIPSDIIQYRVILENSKVNYFGIMTDYLKEGVGCLEHITIDLKGYLKRKKFKFYNLKIRVSNEDGDFVGRICCT